MRSRFRHSKDGFTLIEMLVVLALIGILSLISVPAFINFRNANVFRSDLRNVTHDLRMARQSAISNANLTLVRFTNGSQTSHDYTFLQSADNGATWTPLPIPGGREAGGNVKAVSSAIWFDSVSGLTDATDTSNVFNSGPDLVFMPNGAMRLATGSTQGQVVMRCIWNRVAQDTFTIELSASGNIRSTGSHS